MISLKSLIVTLFALVYSISVVLSQQNELEFYITFTECPNGVGGSGSGNITTSIGECTLIDNCGTYKSIKTVEKFTNNYEGRVFNNKDCKGVFFKKEIWFECIPGGVSAEGSIVYCNQYGVDKKLQFSTSTTSPSTTTSKQTTTITTSGPSSTVVSSSSNSFSSVSSSSSSSSGFPSGITSGTGGSNFPFDTGFQGLLGGNKNQIKFSK
ncbi:hypothetical protein ACTA71_005777 [Dictyostelium dimigraforme]